MMHEKGIRFEEAEDKPFYLGKGSRQNFVPMFQPLSTNGKTVVSICCWQIRAIVNCSRGQGWMLRWRMSPSQ